MKQCWIVTKGIKTKDGLYRMPREDDKENERKVTTFMLSDEDVKRAIEGKPKDLEWIGQILRQAIYILNLSPKEQEEHAAKRKAFLESVKK